jgi:branched-chain amino acid transport system permease protein
MIAFLSSEYAIHLGVIFCLYCITAQGFNIVFGLGGLFNLAHVAFFAVGAYFSAIASTNYDWGFFPCLVGSTLLAGFFSVLIGRISLVLSKDYFAMGTLSFAAIISALLVNWKSLTRGVLGIAGIPRPNPGQFDISESLNFLILCAIILLISQFTAFSFFKTRYARSLKSLALDEISSQSIGQNPRFTRILAFFVSACYAGLAGSLYSLYMYFIDPSSFTLSEMVLILTIAIVAKPGSFWGIFPAVFAIVILIPEGLRQFDPPSSVLGPVRQLLNALVVFIIVYFSRYSLFPKQREI